MLQRPTRLSNLTEPRRPPCFGKSYTLTMPSTSRSYTAYAAHALLVVAMSSTAYGDVLSQMTYKGCYSSSSGLSKDDEWLYQTSGYCQPKCVNKNDAVLATSNGNECWCGNELPPSASKVDDDKCDVPCTGYGSENCKYCRERDSAQDTY